MIWLANYNAGPIASSYDASGKPVPTVSNIALGGTTWYVKSIIIRKPPDTDILTQGTCTPGAMGTTMCSHSSQLMAL